MVNKIGCFITGSWTEAGAMSIFLKKINNGFEYIQCLPNKPKYKKGLDDSISGLSGEALINEMFRRIEKYKNEYSKFQAIILEDDLDCGFYRKDKEYIRNYKLAIQNKIYTIIGKEIPVFFLFASPEIEAWFLSDWNNTFVKVYNNSYFCHRLKNFIDKNIIKEYWVEGIKHFGMSDEIYHKLSDEIINAVSIGVKDEMRKERMNKKLKLILEDKRYYYSKKVHGDMMLKNIDPQHLLEKCNVYFSPAYFFINSFRL